MGENSSDLIEREIGSAEEAPPRQVPVGGAYCKPHDLIYAAAQGCPACRDGDPPKRAEAAPLTEEELAAIEVRRRAIPPPPWIIVDDGVNQPYVRAAGALVMDLASLDTCHHAATVGAFVTHAPQDIDHLLATVRALQEDRDSLALALEAGDANERRVREALSARDGETTVEAVERAVEISEAWRELAKAERALATAAPGADRDALLCRVFDAAAKLRALGVDPDA